MDNLGEVYTTWFDKLVPVAAAIVGESNAEDVVQDVFVELASKPIEIKDPERYLMRAVTNRAINMRRHNSFEPRTFTDVGLPPHLDNYEVA